MQLFVIAKHIKNSFLFFYSFQRSDKLFCVFRNLNISIAVPADEFYKIFKENTVLREVILRMNKELNSRQARAEREREPALKTGEIEE